MRMGAVEFGPFALVFVRVAGAAALLLPILALQGHGPALRAHWRPIAFIGVVNSALPFLCFAVAAYALSAGVMGVFNATAPIWTALIAWAWLGERPAALRALGLAIGLAGAVGLAASRAAFAGDIRSESAAVTPLVGIAACVAATLLYGISANYSRKRLAGVPPMATAAGSQLAAALVLIGPALWAWPAQPPGAAAWGSAITRALLCTGVAYILYFRLIANAGATNAMTVTFLIPVFASLWGWLALAERPGIDMVFGGAAILLGTALALGLFGRRSAAKAARAA
jgi:drug/metabolite transporter (DMT)-like permease